MDIIFKDEMNKVEAKENGCNICDDLDVIGEMVCYIPNDNGNARDVPIRFCPKCGKKINW